MALRLLFIVLMLAVPASLFAQTLTTDDPPEIKIIELVLKALFAGAVGIAPWLTGKLTAGLQHVPFAVRAMISTVLASVIGALFGSIPEFPMAIESSTEIAGSAGLVGQWLASKNPGLFMPKTIQPEVIHDTTTTHTNKLPDKS